MLKAIKIRVYPDKEQETEANKMLGCARFVYNHALDFRINAYETNHESVDLTSLNREIIRLKNTEEYSWLKDAHSKVMQQSLLNLDNGYKRFFKGESGFPKFKSKNNDNSCRFPSDAIIGIIGNRISLTKKISNVLFKCSVRDEKRLNKNSDRIKSVTLSKTKSGKYFMSILVDGNFKKKKLNQTENKTGLDTGIKDFIVTDQNKRFPNLKTTRNNENKLSKLQRNLSRKTMFPLEDREGELVLDKEGKQVYRRSKNREKSRIKSARFHETLANKKSYYLHDVVNQLLNENQVTVREDLNVKGMMANHKLARSIQELSIGEFNRILDYKAKWYGRDVVTIGRWFPSSKLCHCCGWKNAKLKLSDREWVCQECGVIHDRDINAAINILREGIRIRILEEDKKRKIGLSKPELTLEENSHVDDPTKRCQIRRKLKSTCSLNQEGNIVRTANVIMPEK